MDNASWAMDLLHAAVSNTPSDNASTIASPKTQPFVSQFRIDGQPILPPLMTTAKRHEMQQLRKRAIQLEAKYKLANASSSSSTLDTVDSKAAATAAVESESSSCETMSTTQLLPQLQQTQTFIYDSTRRAQDEDQEQQEQTFIYDSNRREQDREEQEQLQAWEQEQQQQVWEQLQHQPRQRPQRLAVGIPTICVNPPTPQHDLYIPNPAQRNLYIPKPPPAPAAAPLLGSCTRRLSTRHRKLNNITSRILQFESKQLKLQQQPTELLWQHEQLAADALDKRMLRSSTSPLLSAQQQQLQRSHSFTLEEPSQALVQHMQRLGNKQAQDYGTPAMASTRTQRCRFAVPATVACAQSLAQLHHRRDTVESKAKQVQRSASNSCVELLKTTTSSGSSSSRRRGGSTRLQQQQQHLEQLLQRALHETTDVLAEQEQLERKQLALAKHKMFKDIKTAHRDRFQQLVQYQHEEQRRMQAEFDRQQKLLIEQICTEINVSAYAQQPLSSSSISAYTSTDDLPTPSCCSPSRTITLNSLDTTPRSYADLDEQTGENLGSSAARKRLFDAADSELDEQPSLLYPLPLSPRTTPLRNSNNNNNKPNNISNISSSKAKKPAQRSQSKPATAKKLSSPVSTGKSPTTRRANTKPSTPTTAKNNNNHGRNQQSQQQSLTKTRRAASPSRQTLPAMELQLQRRNQAATILTAGIRGFLVRRLFRTEQVQRIVQTIRDTLIFVLNLHLETYGSSLDQEEPANIRLKARLLQQLCSASRTLHLIFFQTSIKERMEIIARDRKRIKTKLLAMHVKQSH